jgi:hypothetical protein
MLFDLQKNYFDPFHNFPPFFNNFHFFFPSCLSSQCPAEVDSTLRPRNWAGQSTIFADSTTIFADAVVVTAGSSTGTYVALLSRRVLLVTAVTEDGAALTDPSAAVRPGAAYRLKVPPPVPALPDTERRTSYSIGGTTCACARHLTQPPGATSSVRFPPPPWDSLVSPFSPTLT